MDRRSFIRHGSKILAATSVLPLVPSPGFSSAYQPRYQKVEDLRSQTLTRIAFGSCNRQYASQQHWNFIGNDQPDLWIWLGDNIYADHLSFEERRIEYERLRNNSYYQDFRFQTPIIGTWDDHDYASDNRGGEFAGKDESQELFMDFLGLPANHPVRFQQGVYSSEIFGPMGQQVHVILLDLRYFRASPTLSEGILGRTQWDWLEDELRSSTSDLIILGSSLHVSSSVTGLGLEGWNQFPRDRQRLYHLLDELDVPVIMLSGDRHMAEFTRAILPSGKSVYEFMSSGMTHATNFPLPDRNRIGRVVGQRNYGLINIDWSSGRPDVLLEIKSADRSETYARFQPNFYNVAAGVYSDLF